MFYIFKFAWLKTTATYSCVNLSILSNFVLPMLFFCCCFLFYFFKQCLYKESYIFHCNLKKQNYILPLIVRVFFVSFFVRQTISKYHVWQLWLPYLVISLIRLTNSFQEMPNIPKLHWHDWIWLHFLKTNLFQLFGEFNLARDWVSFILLLCYLLYNNESHIF